MKSQANDFCGFLDIGEDTFAYCTSGHIVTLLPAEQELNKRYKALARIADRDTKESEFYYGNAGSFNIAFLRTDEFKPRAGKLISQHCFFSAPLIVKAAGNTADFDSQLATDWNKYDAITFYGGNINSIIRPFKALDPPQQIPSEDDGVREIRTKPWSEYTKVIPMMLNGKHLTMTLSITQSGTKIDSDHFGTYSLGELQSFIRLTFDEPQDFDNIVDHCRRIKSLVSLLTRRNNVTFDVYLSQKKDNKLYKTAECYLYDKYENYAPYQWTRVLSATRIADYLPEVLDGISNSKFDSLIALFPEDNRYANRISIVDIQNMCTALEVAYGWGRGKREKDPLVQNLKAEIKKVIRKFAKDNNLSAFDETTINSSFEHLDLMAKQKAFILYQENSEIIDNLTDKYKQPNLDLEAITAFIKLRNNKAHSGVVELDERTRVYHPLFAIVYAAFLRTIGVPEEEVSRIIGFMF